MSRVDPLTSEMRSVLYGLRTARGLAEECAHFNNLSEADRHKARARSYAIHIRNIIRERSGIEAYHVARRELRT